MGRAFYVFRSGPVAAFSGEIHAWGVLAVVFGVLVVDLLLGDVHSLKEKRMVLRPLIAELRRRFDVSAAETGDQDVHRRAEVAVSVVASEHGHVQDVLAACERLIAGHPEFELLSTRTRVLDDDDLD